MVLTSVFLFKRLLDILLCAGGEKLTPNSDTAVIAERQSLKQGRKWQKRERIFTVKEEGWSRGLVWLYSSPALYSVCKLQVILWFFSLHFCCHFLQICTIKVILGIKDGLTPERGNGSTELPKCPSRQRSSFCLLVIFHCEKKNRMLHSNTLLIQFLSKFRDIQQRCQHLRKSLWEPHHMEHQCINASMDAFGEIYLTYFKHHYQGEMNLALTAVLL